MSGLLKLVKAAEEMLNDLVLFLEGKFAKKLGHPCWEIQLLSTAVNESFVLLRLTTKAIK